MFEHRKSLVRSAALAATLFALGAAHAAVGEQRLDPGPLFASAAATAPSMDQEMADLRPEIRQKAHAKAAAALAQHAPATEPLTSTANREAPPYAQRLDPGTLHASAAVTAPTMEQEMADLRAEIRQKAHAKAAAALAQQTDASETEDIRQTSWSPPYAQQLVGQRMLGNCIAFTGAGVRYPGVFVASSAPYICLHVLA